MWLSGGGDTTGIGKELNNGLYGSGSDNILAGNGGNDYLARREGRGHARRGTGNDRLDGGAGDDLFIFNDGDGTDATITFGGGDQLTLRGVLVSQLTASDFILPDGALEPPGPDATLIGSAGVDTLEGGIGNDLLVGNSSGDTLKGGAGNDTLDGGPGNDKLFGEAGDDTTIGGAGNDRHVVTDAGDVVIENPGEGNGDWVWSSIDYTLGANVENLYLQGAGDKIGTGNELDNKLFGSNGADDTLVGNRALR